jgi:hypothetical protein
MLTGTQARAALVLELGANLSTLLPAEATTTRWFNEGQARLQWYTHAIDEVEWDVGDLFVAYNIPVVGHVETLYPEGTAGYETRWKPVQGGLLIEDYTGAEFAGDAKVIVRTYWPDIATSTASLLPPDADGACLSYCLYKFFRYLVADRSVYQRYSTLMGENGVGIDDLSNTSDDHYKDFLDGRVDLPVEPGAAFFGG